MKVIEHLQRADEPLISVEIIPPKRGANIKDFHAAVESITPYRIPFINVTSHAADVEWLEQPDGTYRRRVKRKSPGTFGLCALLKYKYNVDPVPHLLCRGFSREETEDALIELNYLGIDNVLVIRGDGTSRPVRSDRTANAYADELISQVSAMNEGIYQDPDLCDCAHTNFSIGAAAYPEKHFESPNLKFGLDVLKRKQDAGAHYAVCQMFFDNQHYFRFVERARAHGITMPIIPGLKILTSKRQVHSIPAAFHVEIPEALTDELLKTSGRVQARAVGVEWARQQAQELFDKGVPCVHFYIMQNTKPFVQLLDALGRKKRTVVASAATNGSAAQAAHASTTATAPSAKAAS
jgi:methylenetetrahydrofolate reductase (NADPH)